ncbi:hypothetical protein HHI36_000116 [Cryptolaemus montrouzieri]|uniref:Estradiol 17-beta-dehydrogenase 2 n=1 Tax=Cryptolaemus montrouzieri TaxID=559131 RepID=A0ABD2P3M7_9CUCU
MGIISKYCLTLFEVMNEIYSAIGAGVFGLALLLDKGFDSSNLLRTATIVCITGSCLLYVLHTSERAVPSSKYVVFITGCDSGLGFSLAQHIADMGFTVIAGFFNLKSKGAQAITDKYSENQITPVNLDLTDPNSITQVVKYVEMILTAHNLNLYAVVNNAGVMVFGEFEWLTANLISQQLNVNLLGTFLLSKQFCPLMRRDKARFITITSHCALASLPGLSIYGATKAALTGWNDALRIEMGKYGVKVVNFIPGSFTTQSNIMANQMKYAYEMHEGLSKEQKIFYEYYFKTYNTYLSFIRSPSEPKKIADSNLYELFEDALLDVRPKAVYKNEPWRYFFYHTLFRLSPVPLRDYFITKFMQMPEYSSQEIDIA